jgi:hypothetical protein
MQKFGKAQLDARLAVMETGRIAAEAILFAQREAIGGN